MPGQFLVEQFNGVVDMSPAFQQGTRRESLEREIASVLQMQVKRVGRLHRVVSRSDLEGVDVDPPVGLRGMPSTDDDSVICNQDADSWRPPDDSGHEGSDNETRQANARFGSGREQHGPTDNRSRTRQHDDTDHGRSRAQETAHRMVRVQQRSLPGHLWQVANHAPVGEVAPAVTAR